MIWQRKNNNGYTESPVDDNHLLGDVSRVEQWRGSPLTPFPSPATSNGPCRFPAVRFPNNFLPKPMTYRIVHAFEGYNT